MNNAMNSAMDNAMNIATTQPLDRPAAAAVARPALSAATKHHNELVKQTQKWVAQSFYGTLFKQMRDDPFRSKLFDGGRGGQVFEQMLDDRLADHMTRGTAPKLVNEIVQKIEGGKASASYMRQSRQSAASDAAQHARSNVTTIR